jgi:hypothetical protein
LYLNNNKTATFLGKPWLGEALKYMKITILFGDLSAILIENMPIWAEFSSTPNNRISLMSEWEAKIAAINETRERTSPVLLVSLLGCLS